MNDEYGYSEGGEMVDRRAGERRAAAPVVAVVAADLATELRKISADKDADALSYLRHQLRRAADEIDRLAALASQAQAAVSAPKYDDDKFNHDLGNYIGCLDYYSDDEHPIVIAAYKTLRDNCLAAQAAVGVASQQERKLELQDPILIPRGLVGAACYLINKHDPENNLLLKLRSFTFNRPMPSPLPPFAAPASQPDASVTVPCEACDGKGGWVTAEWIDPVSGPECEGERCGDCEGTGRVEQSSTAGSAKGGITNDNASPDLASIASQAQGEPIVMGVDLGEDGIAAVRNAALNDAIEACEQVKRDTYDDSIEEWSGAVSCCTAIEALKTPTES